jgi:hypothetical protein
LAKVGAHAACAAILIFILTPLIDWCGANRRSRRPHLYRERKGGPAADNGVLVELIEQGIEAQRQKEKAFFRLAERFRAANDPEQVK